MSSTNYNPCQNTDKTLNLVAIQIIACVDLGISVLEGQINVVFFRPLEMQVRAGLL